MRFSSGYSDVAMTGGYSHPESHGGRDSSPHVMQIERPTDRVFEIRAGKIFVSIFSELPKYLCREHGGPGSFLLLLCSMMRWVTGVTDVLGYQHRSLDTLMHRERSPERRETLGASA